HIHTSRGTTAKNLTSAANVRSAVTIIGPDPSEDAVLAARPAAATSSRATSASLWPPPTACTTTTGFNPTAATAKARRSEGHRARMATAPSMQNPASSLKTAIVAAGDPDHARAMPALSRVNAGPYTVDARTHCGDAATVKGSAANRDGAAT